MASTGTQTLIPWWSSNWFSPPNQLSSSLPGLGRRGKHMPWGAYGGQRTTFWSWLFLYTMQAQGTGSNRPFALVTVPLLGQHLIGPQSMVCLYFLIEILQYYLFFISICLTKVKKLLNLAFSGELVGSTLSMCITYTFSKELEHPIMWSRNHTVTIE